MKISYANMKLKTNTDVNTFKFGQQEVEVLKYLPAQDKYDLLMLTLQKADEGDFYNDFKLNIYFDLHLVYMYTNISFTEKQKENEFKLYDTLKSNDFFTQFFKVLDENEYNELYSELTTLKEESSLYRNSFGGIVSKLITDLPGNAAAAAKIVENFNPQKYKAVIDFARAANGGRDIKTNKPIEE